MTQDDVAVFERGLLEWIAQDAMARLLQAAPREDRDALARQTREELGTILSTAPPVGDPVADVRARAEIAAAFGATYCGKSS